MSISLKFACGVLAFLAISTPVYAQQGPWYISGSAGAYFRSDVSQNENFYRGAITAPGNLTTSFSPGFILNSSIGYKLKQNLRAEFEFQFSKYYIGSINPNTADRTDFPNLTGARLSSPVGGDRERYIEMVNLFYDLPVKGRFVPYIGLGFGVAEDRGSPAVFAETGPIPGRTFTQNNVASGIQAATMGEIGISINIFPQWDLVPSYRFQYLFASSPTVPELSNIVKVGLRRSF